MTSYSAHVEVPGTERLERLWRLSVVAAIVAMLLAAVIAVFVLSRPTPASPAVFDVEGSPTGLAVTSGAIWVAAPRAGRVSLLDADSGRAVTPPLRTGHPGRS